MQKVTISKGVEVKRVHRRTLSQFIDKGWAFCSRKRWKTEVRDQKEYVAPVHEAPTQKKKEKKNKQKDKVEVKG